MPNFDFSLLLNEQLNNYLICLFISISLYFVLFRKQIVSIFDPFTFVIIGSMMGFSVMLFLKQTESIKDYYFFQYLYSQIAFWLGFFICHTKTVIGIPNHCNKPLITKSNYFYLYLFVSAIFIFTTFIKWYISGIPIFQSSRLDAVGVGGGFGFFLRIIDIYGPICLYLTYYFMLSNNKNYKYFTFSCIILILQIIIAFFSGSKASILSFLTMLFLFFILNKECFGNAIKKINKYQFFFISLPILGAICTIIVSSSGDFQTAVNRLLFHLIANGDIYYQAYPNEIVESLPKTNIFMVLFGDILRTLRILPSETVPLSIGFELNNIVNGAGMMSGPNPRHNVYGYLNFGLIGSVVFSFACGLALNMIRSVFFKTKNMAQDRKILILLLYMAVLKIEGDPPAAISYVDNIVLLFPILLVINASLIPLKKNKRPFYA